MVCKPPGRPFNRTEMQQPNIWKFQPQIAERKPRKSFVDYACLKRKKTLKLKCFILLLSRILLINWGFVFFSWKIFRWPFMRIWIQVKTALGLFLPYGRDWEAKNGRYRQLCWHQLTFLGLGRKTITRWDWNQNTSKVELQGDIDQPSSTNL